MEGRQIKGKRQNCKAEGVLVGKTIFQQFEIQLQTQLFSTNNWQLTTKTLTHTHTDTCTLKSIPLTHTSRYRVGKVKVLFVLPASFSLSKHNSMENYGKLQTMKTENVWVCWMLMSCHTQLQLSNCRSCSAQLSPTPSFSGNFP